MNCTWPAHQVGEGRRAAAVGDVDHEEAGGGLEHLRHQVADAAVAGRAVVDLPGPGLGVAHELLEVVHRQLGRDQQRQRLHRGARDRREVAQGVVGQLAVERAVDHRHAGVGEHQRVAVGRALGHGVGAHRAAGAGLVVDRPPAGPSTACSLSVSRRACWSSGPPAGKPITTLMGFSGKAARAAARGREARRPRPVLAGCCSCSSPRWARRS